MEKRYLNAGEAAAELGITRPTLRKRILAGEIPTERDPLNRRAIMIPASVIEQLRRESEKYGRRVSGPKARRVA